MFTYFAYPFKNRQSSKIIRQATGPPGPPFGLRDHQDRLRDHPGRVQGWESVFWGGLWFFGNLKDSKNWLSKTTKIPHPPNLVRKYRHFFKIIVDLVGFACVLIILMIFRFPTFIKIPPPKNSLKALGDTNCFGSTRSPIKKIKKRQTRIHIFDVR